jgi:hypothetical protein
MAHVGSTMAAITLLWLFQAALVASSAPTSMLLSSLPPNAAAQAGLKLEAAETRGSWAPHWIPASSTTAPNSSKQDMQQLQPHHKAPLQSNRPYVIAHRGASGQPSSCDTAQVPLCAGACTHVLDQQMLEVLQQVVTGPFNRTLYASCCSQAAASFAPC